MLTEFGKILRKIRIDNQELLKDMAKKLGSTDAVLNLDEKDIPSEFLKFAHRSKKAA